VNVGEKTSESGAKKRQQNALKAPYRVDYGGKKVQKGRGRNLI